MSTESKDTKQNEAPAESQSRREVRSLIFHLVYAMEGFDYNVSLESIIDTFNRGFELTIPLKGEICSVAQGVIDQREELDKTIKPLLANWRLERIGLCTKLVLRMAIWELQNLDTAPSIVINEAIELAKCFSEKDAYRFVNGVLDEYCKAQEEK